LSEKGIARAGLFSGDRYAKKMYDLLKKVGRDPGLHNDMEKETYD
jgi:hypothetical protein